MGKQKARFILGSNRYKHKSISTRLIKQIDLLRKEMEKKTKTKISFVWMSDNLRVGVRTR